MLSWIKKKGYALFFLLLGVFFIADAETGLTGAVIGAQVISSFSSFYLGLFFLFIGGILLAPAKHRELEERIKIGHLLYEGHALEQIEKRHLMPSVVQDAVEHGEHYRLAHVQHPQFTRGATDAYVMHDVADILPGGREGRRIIPVNPGRRNFRNVIVLTSPKRVVKTAYTQDDTGLKAFFNQYVKPRKVA